MFLDTGLRRKYEVTYQEYEGGIVQMSLWDTQEEEKGSELPKLATEQLLI